MSILDVMLNDDIKKSKAYKKYLDISSGILGELMSLTKTKIAEEEQRLHETYASLVIAREQTSEKGTRKSREDNILQQIPKGSSEGSGSKPEVPDGSKVKSTGSNEGAEKDESKKADEETADEDEVQLDDEVHTEEDKQTDDEAHDDDEYVHDDVEKYDDADEEMNNAENADEVKEHHEMVDAEKVKSKKTKEEKIYNEQAEADQAAKDD
ncbi:hypothetical protein Tco_0373524 [Tanacetum coccineum]